MFVFRKTWRALFSCDTRFEIRPLPYYRQFIKGFSCFKAKKNKQTDSLHFRKMCQTS